MKEECRKTFSVYSGIDRSIKQGVKKITKG